MDLTGSMVLVHAGGVVIEITCHFSIWLGFQTVFVEFSARP